MTTASDARTALVCSVTHRLETALARTPRSDPAEIARIIRPAVRQVLADADALTAAAVAEAKAVHAAEEAVKSAAVAA